MAALRRILRGTFTCACLAALGGVAPSALGDVGDRLVTVDAAITEIVYALGEQDRLVGVDTSSRYPAATEELPTVGYIRALSAEGILGLAPTAVLATAAAGPREVIEQIESAGVPVEQIPDEPTVTGLRAQIRALAELLGRSDAGAALSARIEADLARVAPGNQDGAAAPRVLFLLHFGSGSGRGAGRDTAADTVIRLAGGENVLHQTRETG